MKILPVERRILRRIADKADAAASRGSISLSEMRRIMREIAELAYVPDEVAVEPSEGKR